MFVSNDNNLYNYIIMVNTRRKNRGGNKSGKSNKSTRKQGIPKEKTISEYLKDDLFPIENNQYVNIELETCMENGKYNYKLSNIKKNDFRETDIPDHSQYPNLTIETLREGIQNLRLKEKTQYIRLIIISGDNGFKIFKIANLDQDLHDNKIKCGYGTPIYTEIVPPVEKDLIVEDMEDKWDIFEKELDDKKEQQAKENEARKLQAKENRVRIAVEAKAQEERLAEEARVAAEAKAQEERLAEEARMAAEAKAKAEQERLAEEARVAAEAKAKAEQERHAEEARVAAEAKAQA